MTRNRCRLFQKELFRRSVSQRLVNPAFARLIAGQTVSAVGDSVFTVTVMTIR